MITVVYLWRIPRTRAPQAIWHMAVDRFSLKRDKSVGFFKLIGTGTGETFTPRDADPTLWGLIATMGEENVAAFDAGTVVTAWRKFALSESRYLASPISSHGKWSWSGQVLAITRAKIRWSKNLRFWRAVPPVIVSLRGGVGVQVAIGIGEAPLGLQGTLSIWSDSAALKAFAYKGAAHSAVIRETLSQGWYSEELFARFALLEVRGSVTSNK